MQAPHSAILIKACLLECNHRTPPITWYADLGSSLFNNYSNLNLGTITELCHKFRYGIIKTDMGYYSNVLICVILDKLNLKYLSQIQKIEEKLNLQ